MNLKDFQSKYPDLYQAVFDEGSKAGHQTGFAEGEAAGAEKGRAEAMEQGRVAGAAAERDRIKSVEDQAIPGHDALIQSLKFDGKTTGEQAAVKILQAEKAIRIGVAAKIQEDAPPLVPATIPPEPGSATENKTVPIADRSRAAWDKDAELRAEFNDDYDAFFAYAKAVDSGRVKVISKARR